MENTRRTYGPEKVIGELERADYIANADNWPGDRAERAADVSNAYLRAIAVGLAAVAGELEKLTAATYTAGGV